MTIAGSTSSPGRTPRCHGSTTSVPRTTSASSPTPGAAARSTASPAPPAHPLPPQQRPLDFGGRYIYLRDDADGGYWSPRGSRREAGSTVTSAATGSPTLHRLRRNGIRAETLYFVPLGEDLEVWRLRVTNERDDAAELSVFSAWSSASGTHRTTRQLPAELQRRRGRGGRRRHLPQDRVPRAARPLRLLRLLRAARRLRHAAGRFLGPYRGWDSPVAVERGNRSTRSRTAGRRSARTTSASRSRPGETKEIVFVLGYAENPAARSSTRPAPRRSTRSGSRR